MALATMSARSIRSRFSWTFPRVIRDTSSRSSTSDTMCLTCRSMIVRSRSAPDYVAQTHQLQRRQNRRQRVAQFVAEHRQEFVFRPVRRFGVAPGVGQLGHVERDDRDARHARPSSNSG